MDSRAQLLLIERDADAARATAHAFAGCFLVTPVMADAANGRLASELLRTQAFDVVLADLGSIGDLAATPEDAIARLAKLGGTALTIALTGDGSVSAAVAAMRAGAHDVIGKPLDADTLAVRIGRLGQRHGRALGLVVDGLEAAPAAMHPAVLGLGGAPNPQDVLPMWRQEQRIIEDAIASFAGNIALAAAALELSPSTIYRRRQAWAEMDGERKGAA